MAAPVPSLNWLRVFEAAARTESFARAAEELNMSAAAVSQQVRALEERLGAALFERQAHSVRLTDKGRAYLPGVQQALLTLRSTTEGLFGPARAQPLYVQAVLLFAHGVLAPGYRDFTAAHPGVTLTLTTGNLPYDFTAGGFSEMQIVHGTPSVFGADSDPLLGERLYPVASPETAATVREPADLMAHSLIEVNTHRAGWPLVFEALGVSGGRQEGTPHMIFTDSTLMAFGLARSGAGIALARAPVSDLAMQEAGLVPCLPGVSVAGREAYHLVYADRTTLRPSARAFRSWLLTRCAALWTSPRDAGP
ncbi:MAG: LysR family transcriptional regulator [Pseudomonadota bacterium]